MINPNIQMSNKSVLMTNSRWKTPTPTLTSKKKTEFYSHFVKIENFFAKNVQSMMINGYQSDQKTGCYLPNHYLNRNSYNQKNKRKDFVMPMKRKKLIKSPHKNLHYRLNWLKFTTFFKNQILRLISMKNK